MQQWQDRAQPRCISKPNRVSSNGDHATLWWRSLGTASIIKAAFYARCKDARLEGAIMDLSKLTRTALQQSSLLKMITETRLIAILVTRSAACDTRATLFTCCFKVTHSIRTMNEVSINCSKQDNKGAFTLTSTSASPFPPRLWLTITSQTCASGVFTVTRTSPLTRKSASNPLLFICAETFSYIFALLC